MMHTQPYTQTQPQYGTLRSAKCSLMLLYIRSGYPLPAVVHAKSLVLPTPARAHSHATAHTHNTSVLKQEPPPNAAHST